jgi:hypothetical protein
MNVILLRTNHRHVSATYVTIFRAVKTDIQLQLLYTHQYYTVQTVKF